MEQNKDVRGHKEPGLAAGMLIVNKDKEVFLMRRGPQARNEAGYWSIPGGAIEFGETAVDAVIRETEEECGIVVTKVRMIGYADHIMPEERQHWVPIQFMATEWSGRPENKEPAKCTEIGWFPVSELPYPLSFVVKEAVKSYLFHVEHFKD